MHMSLPAVAAPGTSQCTADAVRLIAALRAGSATVSLCLARVAAAFVDREAWREFAYAQAGDFSREKLGRCGRWLQDLAFLGKALQRLPGLASALTGTDHSPPLGRAAALQVARVASPESLLAWLAIARRSSVRQLHALARAALAAGSHWPPDSEALEPPTAEANGLTDLVANPETIQLRAADLFVPEEADTEMSLALPRSGAAAFEEAFELHRAVTGHTSSLTSFVEALVGEAAASGLELEEESGPPPPGMTTTAIEAWTIVLPESLGGVTGRAVAKTAAAAGGATRVNGTTRPGHGGESDRTSNVAAALGPRGHFATDRLVVTAVEDTNESLTSPWQAIVIQVDPAVLEWANDLLARIARLAPVAPGLGCRALGEELRSLHVLEDELERCTAQWLSFLVVTGSSRRRGGCLGALAEELLGVDRRTVERRVAVRRALAWLPRMRTAYESGALGMQAAWLMYRAMGSGPAEPELERDWVQQADRFTVRMLQDNLRRVERRRQDVLGADGEDLRRPPTDAEWFASLRCVPGAVRARVIELASQARVSQNDNVFLRLRLPGEIASSFGSAIRAACRREAVKAPQAGLPVPACAGLLALLEDFVKTWDDPSGMPKRAGDSTYHRDGLRCMVPGCTVRSGLQEHHIWFRSRCGPDEDWNCITVCKWHHHQGLHGSLLACWGSAPLGLVWRLGRAGVGEWYRNERRLGSTPPPGFSESEAGFDGRL